ncbi:ADP-ribosylglycohydrolase family protein [Synechococcus sp. AH-558-M21]|nr:ADP-ribosylglycohydrolase family protein [Synechococcus sp. AH-558-M21]
MAGGAIGDSLGLAFEGLSRQRGTKLLGNPYPNRLFFGYGMVSDDTEHACMTAIALIKSNGNPEIFERELISQLRLWFLCLPPATGIATAKACIKSIVGIKPNRIGSESAGNGPGMRAAIIGCAANKIEDIRLINQISSRLTHADRRAEEGALLIALGAYWSRHYPTNKFQDFFGFLQAYRNLSLSLSFSNGLNDLRDSLVKEESTFSFAERIGSKKGVSGFILPTTLVALHAWLSNSQDFEQTVTSCILCGGDTDTVAAIAGSLVGTHIGFKQIPKKLNRKIIDYPFSYKRLSLLAIDLQQPPSKAENRPWLGKRWTLMPFRNLILVFLILLHSLRRMGPPY